MIVSLVVCSCSIAEAQSGGVIQFKQKADKEIIEITVSGAESRKVFTVPNPDRLVVDVPSVVGKPVVTFPDNYKGKLVKAARFGQFDPKTSRFVFDLNKAVKVVSTQAQGGVLTIEISEGVANLLQEKPLQDKLPQDKPEKIASSKQKLYEVSPQDVREPKKSNKRYKTNAPPLIIIDPGHGGVDPGTIGSGGTQEKDVVLQYGLALKARLVKLKKYRVRLTRSSDEFIQLRERVAIARRAGASLFISLHADSADELAARGLSVYTVSEKASDKEAEALAARENKSDIIAGMDLSDEKAEVADILISLAQRETKNHSATFADYLVMSLGDKVRMLPNSHRFAGFAVLKAPDIPSVLVEVGFLSHPQEEKELKSSAYRNKVVEGIIDGVEDYFNKKSSAGQEGL